MIELLKDILTYFGVPELAVIVFLSVILLVTVIVSAFKAYRFLITKKRQSALNQNLGPFISKSDVDKATRFYVPTKYQNVSPAADDEPGKNYIASAKGELLPLFLDRVFTDKEGAHKYYLILADSGMGKTTFLINLFMRHTVRMLPSLLHDAPYPPVRLFPLGSPDIWESIDAIENKQETILLLDAFDEDVRAVEDHEGRMTEILDRTRKFKKIAVTCRTQFFPTDKEIPDDTGYVSFGGDQTPYRFQRIYLSVFDDKDIKKYLRKRFAFYRWRKRRRAFEIVKKSPNLVMRPMLLSYINDLVQADRTFEFSYEIYEVLVNRWIDRESKKKALREKYGEEKYKEMLRRFSQALAVDLYCKREERGGYFIDRNELVKNPTEFKNIAAIDEAEMGETEIRSKSLLNRDAEGRYKFSHKSVMEYFLACELMTNPPLLRNFDFDGMSAAENFVTEKIAPFRKLGGRFFVDTGWKKYPFHELEARDLRDSFQVEINRVGEFDLQRLSMFTNLKEMVIHDVDKYYLLYFLYQAFVPVPSESREESRETREARRLLLKRIERKRHFELSTRLISVMKRGAPNILSVDEEFIVSKFVRKYGSQSGFPWIRKPTNEFMSDAFLSDLEPIEQFLKEMRRLRQALPNCSFTY
jgi:hypothetical protein